jgi:hypothetical protein
VSPSTAPTSATSITTPTPSPIPAAGSIASDVKGAAAAAATSIPSPKPPSIPAAGSIASDVKGAAAGAAAAASASVLGKGSVYKVGDKVEAQRQDGRWYRATIAAVNVVNNTYVIDWENGNKDDTTKGAVLLRMDPKAVAGPAASAASAAAASVSAATSAATKPSIASPPALKVGDKVQAQFRDGRWYPATVKAVNTDKTYLVDWESGSREAISVTASSIRPDVSASGIAAAATSRIASVTEKSKYQIGEAVSAQALDGRWYPATVAEVKEDRTYTLNWADGKTKDRVKGESSIRRP